MEKQLVHSYYQLLNVGAGLLFSKNWGQYGDMGSAVSFYSTVIFVFRILILVMILPLTAAILFLPFVVGLFAFTLYILNIAFLKALDASRAAWMNTVQPYLVSKWLKSEVRSAFSLLPSAFSLLPSPFSLLPSYFKIATKALRHKGVQSIKHIQCIFRDPVTDRLRIRALVAKMGIFILSFFILTFSICIFMVQTRLITDVETRIITDVQTRLIASLPNLFKSL